MLDMARVWPIVCQFGIGALLMAVGVWAGWRSGYLDLSTGQDKRFMGVLVGGYVFLLALVSYFTFIAPFPPGAAP